MKRIVFLLITLFIISSCRKMWENFGDLPEVIHIVNNSNDSIGYYVDDRKYNPEFPHMYDSLPNPIKGVVVTIKPKGGFFDNIDFPNSYFSRFPDKKLKIYLFNNDTLNKYSWKEIRESSNYLRRYDLSRQDLDSMNWRITYP